MQLNEYIEYLVEWLREQVKESNTKGLIVGISGGIDSAVVTNLIKKAFPDNSLGVLMPCKSSSKDYEDAMKVVEASGIKHQVVDLTNTLDTILDALGGVENQLTDANTRARLRMTTLYALASEHKYLVVGTDNAAEWYTGYFTKFGDGGVDLVPLVHMTKGEVFEAGKLLGVPESVINRAPSAGLWEGQTDENEMGTTYNMIDKFLKGEEIPEKDLEIINRMHEVTEHKRELAKAPKEKTI